MAKQTSPVRMAGRKSTGKQNAKSKKSPLELDAGKQVIIQKALYEIASAASAVTDMQEFYAALHRIVGKLMYAKSFYVTLYDTVTGTLSSPYFADESGDAPPLPAKIDSSNKSLRGIVLLTGKTLHVSREEIEEGRRRGKFTPMGTSAEDWIGVPLKMGGQVIGMLTVQSYKKGFRYEEQDVRLLEFVTQNIAVALTRARAIEETRKRNAELQIINSVQEGLASKLDITAIYELIGEKVRDVFNVQVVDIVNYDPATNLISMPYSYEKGDRSVITPREPYGFRQQVINSREPLLINQNFVEMASQFDNPLLTGEWPKSALFVPLLVDGKVKSIISIQDLDRENAFSTSDVQLLQTLSNAMSIALENARLFEETQHLLKETEQRAQELVTINTVSAALAGELDLNTLIELVGEQIRIVFKADIAFVALLDKEKGIIKFHYQYGQHIEPIQWGQGITSKIIQSGQPLMINRDMDRQRQQMGVTLLGKRARSFLGVPIFVGGESVGVVSVQHSEHEEIFSESDQRLLSTIAANVGIAFQNARLFDETQRAFQAEREAREQAETLRSVAQALNQSLSLREVFDLVLTEIQKVIPYDSAGIYQVQDNYRVFVTGRGFKNLDDLIGVGFEFNQQDDEIGYLISKSLQPLILEDATEQYPQYFSTGSHAATKIRSYMAVPIVLNQKLIGMITLDREEPDFYKDHHARLAMVFAAQAATAINNARLFDETQRLLKETEQRNKELAIINRIQKGLASKLNIQAMIDLFGDELMHIFPPQERKANNYTVFIALWDPQTKLIQFPYLIDGAGNRFMEPPTELGPGLTSAVIQSGHPLVLNTLEEQYTHGVITFTQDGVHIESQSWLGVPIKSGDQVIGVVSMQDQRPNLFTESDVRLLSTLASSLKVALENARLFDETQRLLKETEQRNAELAIINSVQAALAAQLDMHGIYEVVGEKLREIFSYQDVTIYTGDLESRIVTFEYSYVLGQKSERRSAPLNSLYEYFMTSNKTFVFNGNAPSFVAKFSDYQNPDPPKSLLAVPVRRNKDTELVVYLTIQDWNGKKVFSDSDVRLLETLANSMSIALENARLWEQEKKFRKALQRELEIGREIQAGFLPNTLPQIKGWDIAATLMSAREVAGDFYDAFELPDGTIGLVIGDVCDKGVGAALFMTLFRSLIRAVANLDYFDHLGMVNRTFTTEARLQSALSLTNNYIVETHGESGMFATLFFGILNPQNGTLAYVNGGHEPPLIIREGVVREMLRRTGPAVGTVINGSFALAETRLQSGDLLVAYTDGVPDCRNPHGEFYGRGRLLDVLKVVSGSSLKLIHIIEADLQRYIAGSNQFDDITLLVVRRGM